MTEIEMMRDFPISPDGLRVEIWRRGSQRYVSDDVLRILINEGACAIVERQSVYTPVQETKAKPIGVWEGVTETKNGPVLKGRLSDEFVKDVKAAPRPARKGKRK